jgi:hypothetical protein
MSDYADMARRVGNFRDELEHQHERATREAMEAMQAEVEHIVRRNDSVAREILVSDVQESSMPTAKLLRRSVHVPEWGKYLEHGTGQRAGTQWSGDESYTSPDNPPFAAIREWAHAKPIVPRQYDSIDAASAAIAQSIAEEGTFAHPYLRPGWYGPKGYQHVIDENVKGMRKALRRL